MNILEYERSQETKSHGHDGFPFNIYLCSIPLDFAVVPTHWHNDMEIIYVKKGRGSVTVDLLPFKAEKGDIIVVPPGQLHSIEQIPGHSMEYENIIFKLSMLMAPQGDVCTEEFFQPLKHGKLLPNTLYSENSPAYLALSACLDNIDTICRDFLPGFQLAIKGQLFSFFYELSKSFRKEMPRPNNKSLDRLKGLLKYVETNYQEKISIADAARICNFSQSHFMKFFKSSMGMPFTDYLNDYRITMASRLLTSSSDTVVNIASETGFENLSYFNRVFKMVTGMTPSSYRKTHRNVMGEIRYSSHHDESPR